MVPVIKSPKSLHRRPLVKKFKHSDTSMELIMIFFEPTVASTACMEGSDIRPNTAQSPALNGVYKAPITREHSTASGLIIADTLGESG
jgi:hypothetical protein